MSGRYAAVADCGTARPVTTRMPRLAARLAVSSTSRDLPIPGSPVITTHPPCPVIAAVSAASTASSSASLPITTGHKTCAIGLF